MRDLNAIVVDSDEDRMSVETKVDDVPRNYTDFEQIESTKHYEDTLRAGVTVEMIDGDLLRITSIFESRTNHSILLLGHLFRRNKCIGNMLPKNMKEVTWLLHQRQHDSVQQELYDMARSIYTCDRHEILIVRQLILTNKPYSRIEANPFALSQSEREGLGQLSCRWKFSQEKMCGMLARISPEECSPGEAADGSDLRKNFRDVKTHTGPYTFGDAFCGAGGTSAGARTAGLQVTWGFDKDNCAMDSYEQNFLGARPYRRPVDKFVALKDSFQVDILHLSPPCQTFSPAHTCEGKNDDDNHATFYSVSEVINKSRPRIVTLEETFGLLHNGKKLWLHKLIHMLTDLDFSVTWKVFDLRDFGLAQSRKRLFVFASCPGERLPPVSKPTHAPAGSIRSPTTLRPYSTVNGILANVPANTSLHNPSASRLRCTKLPYNGNAQLRTICTASRFTYLSGQRFLTLRELASLQGFYPIHQFIGPKEKIRQQIGNAVPSTVAAMFFRVVIDALRRADGLQTRSWPSATTRSSMIMTGVM